MGVKPVLALAVSAAAVAVVVASASGSGQRATATWPPQKYRYTGWLSPGSGDRPLHAVVQGDSFVLNFDDRGALGSTPYRVCWSRLPTGRRRCATSIERYPRLGRVGISGPQLRLGRYVAHWFVHSRVVASWPFLYSRERNGG
jgi:hypothetical protein